MDQAHSKEHYPIPSLMRSARGAYAQVIRAQLIAIGVDDMPRNGVFVLANIDSSGGPRQDLASELGVTQQAVSQVVDILVSRGYLERGTDQGDRRRMVLELTGRGEEVVDAAARGVDEVDRQLEERLSPDQIEAMRSGLIALAEIKADAVTSGTGKRRPARQFRRFSPIFPVRDLRAALAHYAMLGFGTTAYEDGDAYGFATRDGIGVHLSAFHDHDHEDEGHGQGHDHQHGHEHGPSAAYLYVTDADALYEEWSQPGIAGNTHPVEPTDYGLREGSHVDPDGNLIRFGSPIEE
jgi:DNA-binding MarR family transcriptional regulator/catechol 2,3-dioxygenase-like lactoylglutathione lyase family enzyme